jgi:hypothetical protein
MKFSEPVHPKDSDKNVAKQWKAEKARRRRSRQLRKLDTNLRDEEAAQRAQRQMVLGEEE